MKRSHLSSTLLLVSRQLAITRLHNFRPFSSASSIMSKTPWSPLATPYPAVRRSDFSETFRSAKNGTVVVKVSLRAGRAEEGELTPQRSRIRTRGFTSRLAHLRRPLPSSRLRETLPGSTSTRTRTPPPSRRPSRTTGTTRDVRRSLVSLPFPAVNELVLQSPARH